MNLGFCQDIEFKFSREAEVWLTFLKLMLNQDSEIEILSRFV